MLVANGSMQAEGSRTRLSMGQDEPMQMAAGPYVVRLAASEEDRAAAFRLRFTVFNLELHEGLESAFADGYDMDRFDAICDHILVLHRESGRVVGTYRVQTGLTAARHVGYYSEQEFDFAPYEGLRGQIVELGRACIHRDHRSTEVLTLLWRGIARYAIAHGARYMMGCCSLSSTDPALGHAVYRSLAQWMAPGNLVTAPTPEYVLERAVGGATDPRPPKLLRTYLAVGARICSEPALDRAFKTIDYLTMLDLHALHPRVAARFLDAG